MTVEDDAAARGGGAGAPLEDGGLFDDLRHDHREIVHLFDRLAQCSTEEIDTLLSLFNQLEEDLQRHLEGEERFLYPVLERHEETRALVLENYELHRLATLTIGGFKALALDDERWRPKLRVLRRLVEQHIDSVERELAPGALRVLERDEERHIAGHFAELRSGNRVRRGGLDAPK